MFEIEQGTGIEIDSLDGNFYIPPSLCGTIDEFSWMRGDGKLPAIVADSLMYTDTKAKRVQSARAVAGFFGRWTMPGYLDSSEWIHCETESELLKYLNEYYGENEEDNEDNEEDNDDE